MNLLEIIFWVVFGAICLWVVAGFVRVFLPGADYGATRHPARGGSHADSNPGMFMTGSAGTGEVSGSDSGGGSGDCGGGGDSSGGC
jgi:uncharacterized membrane protein YgcG